MRYSLSKASIFNARMILNNVPTFPFLGNIASMVLLLVMARVGCLI
jgi:hypothetical protein